MKWMKSILVAALFAALACSCTKDDVPCGTHNGEQLYKGPKGGCYYKNSNGNKEYVERSECNC